MSADIICINHSLWWAVGTNGLCQLILSVSTTAHPRSNLCGMGILRGTGIKPVSIYSRAGRMPTLLRFNRWLGGQDAHSTPIQ
ncbi:hypothetical protein BJP36_43665 [Moorena producens JHB]|uniref:Uncharacterized protein n=1 Tax=Moorena producens (strain JHB) TaxID=1454205 RepID=A0A9Q9UVW7_MOOP1|nr:hypothetical protein [Moorena producens]WAN69261.1 hypothetical protein BJP36_43665 [Moorena producens JHB]